MLVFCIPVLPCRCVVVEDSFIGLQAARAAGMRCIITTSSYTQNEDFTIADAVFDSIGDNFRIDDLTTPGKISHEAVWQLTYSLTT